MANKNVFIPGSSLAQNIDTTYVDVLKQIVDVSRKAPPESETEGKLSAISETGWYVGMPHPIFAAAMCVVCINIEVQALQDLKYLVTSHWGVPSDPLPTSDSWLIETSTESVQTMRALDKNYEPIKIKYIPDGKREVEEAFFAIPGNQLQYNPAIQVKTFDTIIHLSARRHILWTDASLFAEKLYTWPTLLVNYVNANIYHGKTLVTPAGVWLCKGCRLSTRNGGFSWMVYVDFVYRSYGWEDYAFFVSPIHNQIPNDINIPDGMKTPWPTVRESNESPYGAIRPQMLKGTEDFGKIPFKIPLGDYSP